MSNEFNYKKPSEEQVRAALARLGNLSLRRAFYSKLNNPYWIAVLAKQDVFANPPETKVKPNGSVQSDPWPEIDYLARMASIASKEVADVLEPIADSNNDWVRRGIVEAATVLDPADLARLVYKMEKWPDDKFGNFRIDPRDIARVIIRLLESDQHSKGMKLAHAYFCPRPLSTASKYGTEPSAGVEPYWYKECLPSISFALGSSRIPTLVRWLKSYLKHANASTGKRSFDSGNIWRPSIRTAGEYHFREIGNSLIDAVREALMDSVQTDLKPLRLHLKDDQPLIRRIALSVLADSIENIDDKSAKHVSELTQIDRDLLDVAVLVLNDESFIDSNYRSEYLPFIRACLSLRGIINVTPFFKYIKAGPLSIRDERRELYAQEGDTPEEADIRREIYKKHWQHKMLTLVGAEALPKDLQEMLAALNAEYGVLEVKDEVENFEVLREFTSPISIDEMCVMSDDELLKHLRDWHPDPDVWPGPTHEYQGRVLTEAITRQPNRFAGNFEDLKTLRPTYIRAIVSGWRALIESNKVIRLFPLLRKPQYIVD